MQLISDKNDRTSIDPNDRLIRSFILIILSNDLCHILNMANIYIILPSI
jgi:hypothetical protein